MLVGRDLELLGQARGGLVVNAMITIGLVVLFMVVALAVAVPIMVKRNKKEPENERLWADPSVRR